MVRTSGKARAAFSLVEILVVVITIGILAAITVPNLVGATEEARAASIAESFRSIEIAASQYHNQYGQWPASAMTSADMETNFAGLLKGGVVSADPPSGGTWRWVSSGVWHYPYIYTTTANASFEEVGAKIDNAIDDGVPLKGRVLYIRSGTVGYIFYLPRAI